MDPPSPSPSPPSPATTATVPAADDSFLAPFAHPDFDPVAYAAATAAATATNNLDSESVESTEARLAFAAHDLSRQIDALVVANHAQLRATVARFDAHLAHVSTTLHPQLDSLAAQCIRWRTSIHDPARQLKATVAQARAARDSHAVARLLAHITQRAADSLPDLPTHVADPECVADAAIPSLAATLSDLSSALSLADLSGIDLVDSLLAPHIAGCRAALLARCNAMVHPKDLARTRLALQGLATLGVLNEWHALRRAKVVGKLDNVVREWVEGVCTAEQQKARGSKVQSSAALGLAQFDAKVVDFLAAEAQFLHVLLATHPIAESSSVDPWADFWSAVSVSLDRNLASSPLAHASPALSLAYPSLCTSLATLAARAPAPIPLDLPRTSLAPLNAHYLARVQSLIQASLTSLFQPTHRPSSSLSSSSASLPPVPTCDALASLVRSWTAHVPGASRLVANGIDQLAASLLSLCSDSILLVELFNDSPSPTPAQLQVAHVARALLSVSAATADSAADEVRDAGDRGLADAAHLVDILLQAVLASVHAAMLDAAAAGTSPVPVTQIDAKLAVARTLLTTLSPAPAPAARAAFVTHARLVLAGTLLQHVPVLVALTTPRALVADRSGRLRVVDALAAVEASIARVLDGHADVHAVGAFRHLQALRVCVLAGDAGGEGNGQGAAWVRAARTSPVVVGVWCAVAGAEIGESVDVGRWSGVVSVRGKKVAGRDVVAWALGWVERWDAAVGASDDEDKRRVWGEWEVVMDRALGEGVWKRVVGEFGAGEVHVGRDVEVEDE